MEAGSILINISPLTSRLNWYIRGHYQFMAISLVLHVKGDTCACAVFSLTILRFSAESAFTSALRKEMHSWITCGNLCKLRAPEMDALMYNCNFHHSLLIITFAMNVHLPHTCLMQKLSREAFGFS